MKRLLLAAAVTTALWGTEAFQWRSVKLDGMGFVSGILAHPAAPHDIYVRTDVGGVYRLDRARSSWIPLSDTFSPDESAQSVESLAFDPADANTLYSGVSWNSEHRENAVLEVVVSSDKGAHWKPLGLAPRGLAVGGNAPHSGSTGERLAVDPHNKSRLLYGSQKDGLWIYNGHSWKRNPGLPVSAAVPGVVFVIADSRTSNVYAGVFDSGVWMSKDSGSTWANISPVINPKRGLLASDGTLFVVFGDEDRQGSGGGIQKYHAGGWVDITPPGVKETFSGLTVDPTDPKIVVTGLIHDMKFWRSADQGSTWKPIPNSSASNQPGYYLAGSPTNNLEKSAGWGDASLLLDPAHPSRLYSTNGFGVLVTEDVAAGQPVWLWLMDNLNELCLQQVKVPPVPGGADLLSVSADMIGFRHEKRDIIPSQSITKFDWVAQGVSLAYSAGKPEYSAFVGWDQPTKKAKTGFTTDNGKSWTPFADSSPGAGGNIAMAAKDPMNLVWAPVKAAVVYSKDGGKSWKPSKSGEGAMPAVWQLGNLWWGPHVLTADMVLPNTFYLYSNGAFFSSRDGGANWDRQSVIESAGPPVPYTINVSVVANPVKAGDIWISLARNPAQTVPFRLLHSVDGGKTFGVVESLAVCSYVAFGKGNSPTTPFLYAYGRAQISDYDGIFKSEDMGKTWIALSDEKHQFPTITTLEGDMRTKDLVYAGTAGRGIFYGFGPASGIAGGSAN